MKRRYYHLAPILLGEGSTILPGNFIRIRSRFETDLRKRRLEDVYETVRQRDFPLLPSRNESVFICETLEGARTFAFSNNRIADIMYEVETTEDDARLHRADYSLVDVAVEPQELEEQARNYWRSTSLHFIEVLAACPIRVVNNLGPLLP